MSSPKSSPNPSSTRFLCTSPEEMHARGWDQVDVLFVSGDAYVDHPSFANALLGRVLEEAGFRVALLCQPHWKNADAWRPFGAPRLFCAVSAGNMDSMINHYTANRKPRSEDAYTPGGLSGSRPDRATNVYAQRCREAFPGVPVVIGGVEPSLRRVAHFDYWSETVRPSMLVSSKADLLGFGMGEQQIVEIARRLQGGLKIEDCRDLRGVAYLLGRKGELPKHRFDDANCDNETRELPSYELVKESLPEFARMTRMIHHETNPLNARRLVQAHGDRRVVINPPCLPFDEDEMDQAYDLPYTRQQHPAYTEPVPAHGMIKDSVTIMRGCFGGCTFCSITMHQGRAIQSRSHDSVMREVKELGESKDFKGTISDIGGPTANMYQMKCGDPEVEAKCRRLSCIHPTVCKLLDSSHEPTKKLMRESREMPGVKRVFVASGVRMDLAREDPEYLEELAAHHVGGHLKVAPEHVSDKVLVHMKKPGNHTFEEFAERFEAASRKVGKEQYLVPYYIASHPGSGTEEMIELALFLKQSGYKPRQVQDFIPAPMDIATCMYHTGLDPMTMKPVETVKKLSDRRTQKALIQFFVPENWFVVRRALLDAGRPELIGDGPECLIPSKAPRAAVEARRSGASAAGGKRRPSRRS
ncbi:MAG: putative radical SAM protein YgiQ [Planctomycetota bacterium]|jgi:uncharacterized radical SAM protein YgiQ